MCRKKLNLHLPGQHHLHLILRMPTCQTRKGWRGQLGLGEQSLWDRMEEHRMCDPSPGPFCCRGHAKPWSGLCLAGNDLLLLMRWQKLAGSWNTASNAQTNAARPCLTQLSVWPSKGYSTGSTSTSSTQGHQRKPQKTTKGSQHFVL